MKRLGYVLARLQKMRILDDVNKLCKNINYLSFILWKRDKHIWVYLMEEISLVINSITV